MAAGPSAPSRRSAQVLVSLGTREGAAAVEQLRGWGYACGGLLPGYLEGGRHAAIMYRNFAAPHFAGISLHAPSAERLLSHVVADWQRAQGHDTVPRGAPCAALPMLFADPPLEVPAATAQSRDAA